MRCVVVELVARYPAPPAHHDHRANLGAFGVTETAAQSAKSFSNAEHDQALPFERRVAPVSCEPLVVERPHPRRIGIQTVIPPITALLHHRSEEHTSELQST